MSKKMMLLALAVASAALFALPAFASAEEIHWDAGGTFTGTGAAGSLTAKGEPKISCTTTDVTNGVLNAGGTTGSMTLDFTGCSAPNPLGGTAPCKSAGAPLNNTIASGGTFHLITVKSGVPGVLVTANTTELKCEVFGFNITTHVEGNVIGTIISPSACGVSSNKMTVEFKATSDASGNPTQEDELYTGNLYDLIARTGGGGGTPVTAALEGEVTLTNVTAGTLTCT